MPERPDLEYVVPILDRELRGARIDDMKVKKPVVLRVAVGGDPAAALIGRTIGSVSRRGPYVWFALGDIDVIVHPMLAGRFLVVPAKTKANADLAVVWALADGRELRYRDDVQMGKVWIVPATGHARVPGFEGLGVDVLSADFTLERFRAVAKKRRDQVKSFLLDHAALDTLGNAYSDEVMWAARIHPRTRVTELSPDQIAALHQAIVGVLRSAVDEIARRKPATDEKLRDFLSVRNKKGQPCPRCGTAIRTCGVHGHDAFFCPTCQPDAQGRGFVDWRRIKGA